MKKLSCLQLAKMLQEESQDNPDDYRWQAGQEIERLHEANQAMLEALKGLVAAVEWGASIRGSEGHLKESADIARAAIEKGEQA